MHNFLRMHTSKFKESENLTPPQKKNLVIAKVIN